MRLTIEKNTEGIKALLEKLEGPKLRGALAQIGTKGVDLVQDEFESSTDPYGQRWKPLAPSTLESIVPGTHRRRESFGTMPLVIHRELKNSFNWQLMGKAEVEIGTPKPWAKYHQGNESGGKGILPRRMMLPTPERGLPKKWQTEFIGAIEAYLEVS